MKSFAYALLAFSLLPISAFGASESYDPTDDLNAAFSGGCSTSGELTAAAEANSAALKGVLTAAKNDDKCRGISPLFDGLAQAVESSLKTKNTESLSEEEVTGYINDMKATLVAEQQKTAASQDLAYISLLQTEITSSKRRLLEMKRSHNYARQEGHHDEVKRLFSSATALMQGLQANTECANSHPNLLAQVGAQILKLSSDYATGLTGTLLLASGNVVDKLISFVRDNGLAKQIRTLREAELSRALGCTLESLAATWCQARDVRLVALENKDSHNLSSCQWKGVDLVGHDMASFMQWTTRVYAGSPSGSTMQSNEKLSAIGLRATLEMITEQSNGYIGDAEREIAQTSPDKVTKLRKALINKLVDVVNSNSNRTIVNGNQQMTSSGPIGDTFVDDQQCGAITYFYSAGKKTVCGPLPNETCDQCLARNQLTNVPPMDQITKQMTDLLTKDAVEYVSRKESLTKENNPQLVLAMADDILKNQARPRDFLVGTQSYLNFLLEQKDGIATGAIRETIELLKGRIDGALAVLDHPTKGDPKEDVRLLATKLAPGGDTFFVPKELQAIVKRDVDDKVRRGLVDDALAAVMELSTTDSVKEFLKNYKSLDKLDLQIDASQDSTRRHLNVVWDSFKKNFEKRIEGLKEASSDDRIASKQLAFECARMLLVPFEGGKTELPKSVKKACQGQSHKSVYKEANLALDFDALSKEPFEKRACSVYDFFRKSEIYADKRGKKR